MKRAAPLMIGIGLVTSLSIAGSTAAAGTSPPGGSHSVSARGVPVVKNGAVKSGSQWTFYYYGWEGTGSICETLTFATHTFTGDNESTGAWRGNIKLTFTGGLDYHAGDIYVGKYKKSGTYAGDFVGSVTHDGLSYSPFVLVPGASC
jgi:hypothetical protein